MSMGDRSLPARRPLPPGPRGHFVWGMLPAMRRDMLAMYRDAARQYGDVVGMRFAGVDKFTLSHPDMFKHVLQDNNRNYRRNQFLNNIVKLFVGDNLFTSDGDDWLSRRRLMLPAFHRQRILAFGTLMTDSVAALLECWGRGPDGQRLEIDQEMMALTLQVAGRALFSRDLLGEASALGQTFTGLSDYTNYRMGHPFAPPLFLPTRRNRKFRQARRVLDQQIYAMIRERRQPSEPRGDLLSMLMQARDADTGQGMNGQQLRNEIGVMMFAGHETTSATLTWAFYLLSQNPVADTMLHAELDLVLAGRAPTVADLPQLPYSRRVIDETLRLYPPAFAIGRQTVGADEVGGFRLPANAGITLVFNNVHHDPRFWDEPDRFDPQRFTAERSAGRPLWAYLPFGGGPRLCIGNQFALTEAQLVLASIAQRYQLRLVPATPCSPTPSSSCAPAPGCP
jgi:cytochrome P450